MAENISSLLFFNGTNSARLCISLRYDLCLVKDHIGSEIYLRIIQEWLFVIFSIKSNDVLIHKKSFAGRALMLQSDYGNFSTTYYSNVHAHQSSKIRYFKTV